MGDAADESVVAAAVVAAARSKEAGNDCYRAGDMPGAIGHYTEVVDGLSPVVRAGDGVDDSSDSGSASEARTMLATVLSNRAQCLLKTSRHAEAAADCTACLVLDATNVKALYRRAQALERIGQAKAALRDYDEVARLDPSQAKAAAKARRRFNKAVRQALSGGGEAGSGGRGGGGGKGAGGSAGQGMRVDGLTWDEANELTRLKERVDTAKQELRRANIDVNRLQIVSTTLAQPQLGNVYMGVGKMYIRQPLDEARSKVAEQRSKAMAKVESTQRAATALAQRFDKLLDEFRGLQRQRQRQAGSNGAGR